LFFINRNRKLGWYEDGDEKKDGKYVGEIENIKEHTLILMGKNMWVNGRVGDLGSENYMTKTETSLESG